ncbi:MAG: dienelactone hydrolase family protein [Pseudohongiellaceae bacterium]|jgi:carboxymethylenebutenolidase
MNMIDRELDIQTHDGAMNTFITHPEEGGPHPVVLLLMDAPGKREELHTMATRLGTAGYYVMVPNLYYRRVREYILANSTREEMYEHMNSLSNEMVCKDIVELLRIADSDSAAKQGKVGCVGYCMSGPFAFAAAAKLNHRIAAAASFHGIRLFTDAPDSPHLDADKINGEIYFGCAETDDYAPKAMIDALDHYLAEKNTNYRIEWYPGTEHGFVFPGRIGKYNEVSAERHWERLLALFNRWL